MIAAPSTVVPSLLERRLASFSKISTAERDTIARCSRTVQYCRAGEDLTTEGEPDAPARVVLTGWAYRTRVLFNGKRQVFAFLLPGDMLGVDIRGLLPALSTATAITPVSLGDASPLVAAIGDNRQNPSLVAACTYAERLNEVNLLDHIVRLGSQTAYERTAHLLLELCWRLDRVGMVEAWSFLLPVTQQTLADALGLSVVHVNRTVQQLRRDGLIELSGGRVHLLDPAKIAHLANYHAPHPWRGPGALPIFSR